MRIRSSIDQTRMLAILLAYFIAYLIIRISFGGSLERDEAEAVYLTQQLQFGYGTQPPLYAWLQWLTFSLFGLNRFSLTALKCLILIGIYISLYRIGRPLLGVRAALAATASLVFFLQIGWESLRDLTHSVLLTSIACATLWCYFALLREQKAERYALLGLLVGLGLQTKYNFALFLTGLVCTSLLLKEHRSALWNKKIMIAVTIAVIVFLPHGLWLLQHIEEASAGTLRKMAEGAGDASYLKNVATGLAGILFAPIAFAVVPAIVYAATLWRAGVRPKAFLGSAQSRFFLYLYGSSFVLLIAIVLTGEVGKIKDRWMMPLLVSLPIAAFVMLPALRRRQVGRTIQTASIAFALLVLIVLPLRLYLVSGISKIAPPHHPYAQLSHELERRFPDVRTVITDSTLLAGNLRFARHELTTMLLSDVVSKPTTRREEVLLVMPDNVAAASLDRFRAAYPSGRISEHGKLRLGYNFGAKGSMTFDYVVVSLQ